jgi:hypothetical protein
MLPNVPPEHEHEEVEGDTYGCAYERCLAQAGPVNKRKDSGATEDGADHDND